MTHPYQRLYQGPKAERELRKQLRQDQQQNALIPVEPIKATAITTPRDIPAVSVSEQKPSLLDRIRLGLFLLCVCLVVIAFLTAIATEGCVIAANGFHQTGHPLPAILAEIEKWIPVIRDGYYFLFMIGLPGVAKYLWEIDWKLSSTGIWVAVPFLLYYGFLINAEWNSNTSHSTARGNVSALQADLLTQPDIALAKESYDVALADKRKAETDEKYQCSISDGTKCIKAKSRTKEANSLYEAKSKAYSDLVNDAKRKASRDANPAQADIAHLIEWVTRGYVRPSENDIANQQLFFRTAIALIVGVILALLV
jgi:hypothetical protein